MADISDETIRRLEKGKYCPSVQTFHVLSLALRINFNEAFHSICSQNSLNTFYETIDYMITNNEENNLSNITKLFDEYKGNTKDNSLWEIRETKQFELIIKDLEKSCKEKCGSQSAIEYYQDAIKIGAQFISFESLKYEFLSYLEARAVFFISIEYTLLDDNFKSIKFLLIYSFTLIAFWSMMILIN